MGPGEKKGWVTTFDGTQAVAFAIALGAVGQAIHYRSAGRPGPMWSYIVTAVAWFGIFGLRRWRRRRPPSGPQST